MRRRLIAGNWKMHGSLTFVADMLQALRECMALPAHLQVAIFPPYVYLKSIIDQLNNLPIQVGGQNLSTEAYGAFTGEISATMLTDIGCSMVIVGHSERRQLFGETNHIVAEKAAQAFHAGLVPILCVGETLAEREQQHTESVIQAQLQAILVAVTQQRHLVEELIIAYEPIWAIGTGLAATPNQAEEVHQFIRHLVDKYDSKLASHTTLLYGGSVKADNTAALLSMPNIDGVLIGGASLKMQEFLQIIQYAAAPVGVSMTDNE